VSPPAGTAVGGPKLGRKDPSPLSVPNHLVYFCLELPIHPVSCCRSIEYEELRGREKEGDDEEQQVGISGDRLIIDGFLHANIGNAFNDFRLDPFKETLNSSQEMDAGAKGAQGRKEMSTPNCRFVEVMIFGWSHVFFIATADLQAGVELTVDYGEGFWETLRFHRMLDSYAEKTRQLNSERPEGPDVAGPTEPKLMPFRALMNLLAKL